MVLAPDPSHQPDDDQQQATRQRDPHRHQEGNAEGDQHDAGSDPRPVLHPSSIPRHVRTLQRQTDPLPGPLVLLTAAHGASYRPIVNASDVLRSVETVLLVDYPSREVPDTLARAGYAVFVQGGPGPKDYLAYDVEGEHITERRIERPPRQADLVYVYRPVEELAAVVQDAQRLGARAVWCETGSDEARQIVEEAGLVYVDEPSIVNVARDLS